MFSHALMLLILTMEMLLHDFFFFFAPLANERVGDGGFELRFSLWEDPGNSTKLQ